MTWNLITVNLMKQTLVIMIRKQYCNFTKNQRVHFATIDSSHFAKFMLLDRGNLISTILVLSLFISTTCLSAKEAGCLSPLPSSRVNVGDSLHRDQDHHNGYRNNSSYTKFTAHGEKVYLHLDRLNYLQGDTIWFKAYVWFGFNQVPDTISRVLYVELINPDNKIVSSKKLLIQHGTSFGDFSLDKNLAPGRYFVRSYTRWMQNPNIGEPFCQTITINQVKQNFQVECTPTIIKREREDSLLVNFRFFELDSEGNVNSNIHRNINYDISIGGRPMLKGQTQAINTLGQNISCGLNTLNDKDSMVLLSLSSADSGFIFRKTYQIPLKRTIDLQFFPEEGNLVGGLESKVAFKAIGIDGLSREVKGVIKDDNGDVIIHFKSSCKGMGSFLFTPQTGKTYFAYIENTFQKYPLPISLAEGCIMSVNCTGKGSNLLLRIKCSPTGKNVAKYVVGSAYGKPRIAIPVETQNDSVQLQIPIEKLPEGICRLTVLGAGMKPECERLIYVNKNERFKIEIISDSSVYGARSKVSLNIKVTGADGLPVKTDLSLSIVDMGQTGDIENVVGINAYKLLESELQGYVEDVGFYFKGDSLKLRELDLLLLTQGYRRFLPDSTNNAGVKFKPEKIFTLTGRIEMPGKNSRKKGFNYRDIGLNFVCLNKAQSYADKVYPDSLGRFSFRMPLFYGKANVFLSAAKPKKKPFKGEVYFDGTVSPPPFTVPFSVQNNIALPTMHYIERLQAEKKAESLEVPPGFLKNISISEVIVKGKDKYWYKRLDKYATKVVNLDSIDPTGNKFESLNDLLVRQFGAIEYYEGSLRTIKLPCNHPKISFSPPLYVINGSTYFNGAEQYEWGIAKLSHLSSMRVNEIKKIMVLKVGEPPIAKYADPELNFKIQQSMVVIEMYDKGYRGNPKGGRQTTLEGLDTPRSFYSPIYNSPLKDSQKYDHRATLYWNPDIKTDSVGQAKVDFFTTDRQTNLGIIANGIELESGFPGQGFSMIKNKSTPLEKVQKVKK